MLLHGGSFRSTNPQVISKRSRATAELSRRPKNGSSFAKPRTVCKAWRIRRMQPSDVPAVSEIWREALLLEGLTSHGKSPGSSEALQRDASDQLHKQLQRKTDAAQLTRQLRAERAALLGLPAPPGPWTQTEAVRDAHVNKARLAEIESKLLKLRRQRLSSALLIEALSTPGTTPGRTPGTTRAGAPTQPTSSTAPSAKAGQPTTPGAAGESVGRWQVVGYVLLSLTQPLAQLPPPFPSSTPLYLHIDALAVSPGVRRQGVATKLLEAAERLALLWGRRSLWLHVDESNIPAVQLYRAAGYAAVARQGLPWNRQVVMRKLLQRQANRGSSSRSGSSSSGSSSSSSISGSSSSSSKREGEVLVNQAQQAGGLPGDPGRQGGLSGGTGAAAGAPGGAPAANDAGRSKKVFVWTDRE